MKVEITEQGKELYPTLKETWDTLVPMLHVPHGEFVVWGKEYRSWASDVFMALADGLEVESDNCLDIVAALKSIYDLPNALLEELVDTLIQSRWIKGNQSPKEHQTEWLDMVLADVLSHRTRMAILREARYVSRDSPYLEAALGGMPTMTVRFHLNKLVKAEFLEVIREGHNVEYALMVPMLCVFSRRWIRCIIEDQAWLPA